MYKKIKTYIKNYFLFKKLIKKKTSAKEIFVVEPYAQNVLIIDDKLPEFDKDSGSRRLNLIIDILLKNNVGVYLIADFKEYKYKTDYINYYKNKGVIVYQPYIDNNSLITKTMFIKTILNNISLVWLHRPLIFKKYYPIIREYNKKIKIAYDMVDFHFMRMNREADLKNDEKLKQDAFKFLKIELENCKKADKVIVISQTDMQNLLQYYYNQSKMVTISNIHNFIKNNLEYKPFSKRKDLLFVGSFDHLPNIDAVKHLCEIIMPMIWKNNSEIKLKIIGSNPTQEILNLRNKKIEILGYVEDLSSFFNTSKLFVAPLRYGAGIKGKIGQSMEYGLPLITTTIGAEGFNFFDCHKFIVEDDEEIFAKKILAVYNNENLWNSLSKNSETTLKPFSEKTITESILNLIE